MNYITDQIKRLVPLSEAVENYTGERLIKNKMRCPFHNEKTASFTVYPKSNTYYCFGCAESGDIIKFVQRYFNVDFKEAIKRLDYDYNLGLTQKPTFSEHRRRQKQEAERKAEQERQRELEKRIEAQYWQAFDRVLQLEQDIKQYCPASPEAEPHPKFLEALQNIEHARYLLDCAEIERIKK